MNVTIYVELAAQDSGILPFVCPELTVKVLEEFPYIPENIQVKVRPQSWFSRAYTIGDKDPKLYPIGSKDLEQLKELCDKLLSTALRLAPTMQKPYDGMCVAVPYQVNINVPLYGWVLEIQDVDFNLETYTLWYSTEEAARKALAELAGIYRVNVGADWTQLAEGRRARVSAVEIPAVQQG